MTRQAVRRCAQERRPVARFAEDSVAFSAGMFIEACFKLAFEDHHRRARYLVSHDDATLPEERSGPAPLMSVGIQDGGTASLIQEPTLNNVHLLCQSEAFELVARIFFDPAQLELLGFELCAFSGCPDAAAIWLQSAAKFVIGHVHPPENSRSLPTHEEYQGAWPHELTTETQ